MAGGLENKLLMRLAKKEFKVSVDAIDEKPLIVGFKQIAKPNHRRIIIAARLSAALLGEWTEFSDLGLSRGWRLYVFFAPAGAGLVLLLDTFFFYDKSKE